MRHASWIVLLVLGVVGAAPEPKVRSLGRAEAPESRRRHFRLVGSEFALEFVGHDIGRGGYSVRSLPKNSFTDRLNVVTPTLSRRGEFLAFEFLPAGRKGWRIGLAERRGTAFHFVAQSEHDASWADWAVASPDGKRVAAWVAGEFALHVMERRGDKLVVVDRFHKNGVKAFPKFAPNGRLAARVPLQGKPLQFANSIDGKLGETLRACREVQFDATGERWAYAGLRKDGWYLFTDGAVAGPYVKISDLELNGPERVRARVLMKGGWRRIAID